MAKVHGSNISCWAGSQRFPETHERVYPIDPENGTYIDDMTEGGRNLAIAEPQHHRGVWHFYPDPQSAPVCGDLSDLYIDYVRPVSETDGEHAYIY